MASLLLICRKRVNSIYNVYKPIGNLSKHGILQEVRPVYVLNQACSLFYQIGKQPKTYKSFFQNLRSNQKFLHFFWNKNRRRQNGTTLKKISQEELQSLPLRSEIRQHSRSTRRKSRQEVAFPREERKKEERKPRRKRKIDQFDFCFNDTDAAFKSRSTAELLRAFLVYMMCSSNTLVDNNAKIMKISKAILGKGLFKVLMKSTFYGHFVAGEDQNSIMPLIKKNLAFGVKPILDYAAEEDLSQEEAEKRELKASVSALGDKAEKDSIPQYHVDKNFVDRRYKVTGAKTYFYTNEANCEKNLETFIECIEAASSFGSGFAALKLTALGRPQLLLQLSEVIMRARKYMAEIAGGTGNVLNHHKTIQDLEKYYSYLGENENIKKFLKNITSDKDGILHLFPWSGIVDENYRLSDTFRIPDPATGQMRRLISVISDREEEMFRNMIRRLTTIAGHASRLNVHVMVDAEQSYFQPAIARITLEMMRKFNKKKAVVLNTYQGYLKNTFQEMITDLEQAKRQNFYFGAKLVRGAYLEHERARAAEMNYDDPTNPDYDATTEMYNKLLSECLRRIKKFQDLREDPKKIEIMVASHNEDTVRFAIQKMQEYGIEPKDEIIHFGQLLGMCDYITFPMGQAGYSTFKYMPYGPVDKVMPYLSRRANENKGILKKVIKEKHLLRTELKKRIFGGKLFYRPVVK